MMPRRPKGYTGHNHETIGSDILAVLKILKLPEQVLTAEDARRIKLVRPDGWYPIAWLVDLLDTLDRDVGPYGLMRMGRTLFSVSHEERVTKVARSARDIVYGLDDMYHHANRGTGIGGWRVVRFEPGYAEVEKTTPHHCIMEQGLLTAALAAVHCPGTVVQTACFRQGADACVFSITSSFTDERWSGVSKPEHQTPLTPRPRPSEPDRETLFMPRPRPSEPAREALPMPRPRTSEPELTPMSRRWISEPEPSPAPKHLVAELELPPVSRRRTSDPDLSPLSKRPSVDLDLELPPVSRRRF